MWKLAFAAITILATGCSASRQSCSSPDARSLVEALQPKEQLRTMLKRIVTQTTTFAIAVNTSSDGGAKIDEAIDKAVESHSKEWEANLVESWQSVGRDGIIKACKALKDGDESSFMQLSTIAGAAAEKRNGPVLKRAGVSVLEVIGPS